MSESFAYLTAASVFGGPGPRDGVRVERTTGRSAKPGALRRDQPDNEQLADRALKVAYRTALGLTRNPDAAADIAQDVAIKAVKRAGRLRDPQALEAWVHRVTVRTTIDHHRAAESRRKAEDGYRADAPVVHNDVDVAADEILDCLALLTERQRAAVTLRFLHDLDDQAIARALGCRTGTVRSLLSRGTAILREELGKRRETGGTA
jgi:RNA polymerase sigma-70 factor (ECF subfamily)